MTQVGSVEPACDGPHHRYPPDPDSVYPGGSESALTDQWTNQAGSLYSMLCAVYAAMYALTFILYLLYTLTSQVYRAALRVPALQLPSASSTQVTQHTVQSTNYFINYEAYCPAPLPRRSHSIRCNV